MGQEPAAPLVTASDGRTDVAGSSREAGTQAAMVCARFTGAQGGRKRTGQQRDDEASQAYKTRDLLKGRPRGGENF